MAMIKCTKCGKMYDNDPRFHNGDIACPHCGRNKATVNIMNGANIFAWVVMSAIVFGIAWLFNPVFSWVGWIIAFSIVFVLIPCIAISQENTEKLRATQRDEQTNFITQNNITISKEYTYKTPLNDVNIRVIFDNINKNLFIAETSKYFYKIPFSKIIGCEIITDSQVTGGVKRAIVGGILAGEMGAAVGAITAKKHIMSYKIALYLNNIDMPKRELELIKTKKSTKDNDYINAVKFAENISATIKAIIYQS